MITISKEQEQIARIAKGLHCTEQEARAIYQDDCAIDHGQAVSFDLPQEKLNVARKFAHTGTRKAPPAYKFTKRERKSNATKAGIIAELFEFLNRKSEFSTENVTILNKERQISFKIGEETYELTLVQKRKSKTGAV